MDMTADAAIKRAIEDTAPVHVAAAFVLAP